MKEINVVGTIVDNDDKWIYEWCDIQATAPKDVDKALEEANGEDVTIFINSGGGSVFAGSNIYRSIKNYKGKTTVEIAGVCASAATMIACAGDHIQAVPGAMYMIHNVSSSCGGDYNAHEKEAQVLKVCNKAISEVYQQRTGKTEKELLKMMDFETWMSSKEAKEQGFIDEVTGEIEQSSFQINNSYATILSDDAKKKIRDMANDGKLSGKDKASFLVAQKQIQILRMKGEIPNV